MEFIYIYICSHFQNFLIINLLAQHSHFFFLFLFLFLCLVSVSFLTPYFIFIKVCSVLDLDADLTYYFGLYLVDDLDGKVIVRKLQDFESPYISLDRAEPHQKIQVVFFATISSTFLTWENKMKLKNIVLFADHHHFFLSAFIMINSHSTVYCIYIYYFDTQVRIKYLIHFISLFINILTMYCDVVPVVTL